MRKSIEKFKYIFMLMLITFNLQALSNSQSKLNNSMYQYGPIKVLVLNGTTYQMGVAYGNKLKSELHQALAILKKFYIVEHKLKYKQLIDHAELLYNRFPQNYKVFLQGSALGSNLSLDDIKVLNAMSTYTKLTKDYNSECAFLFLPGNKTTTGKPLIGRNFDYVEPLDQLSKYLIVTILKENNKIPTAFISIAGQIYCQTCLNSAGVFMELNNGMPSGGYTINQDTETMLSKMLITLQSSKNLIEVKKNLNGSKTDFSLIVNAAADKVYSFEFSSTLGMKLFLPTLQQVFASTNFFLNPSWEKEIPIPTDSATWNGVSRRNNLLKLASIKSKFSIRGFKNLMDKNIAQGGAVWAPTLYQLIFDKSNMMLYIKLIKHSAKWTKIPVCQFLDNN